MRQNKGIEHGFESIKTVPWRSRGFSSTPSSFIDAFAAWLALISGTKLKIKDRHAV
jgi:hypothetical protein